MTQYILNLLLLCLLSMSGVAHAQTFSFPSSWTTGNPTTTVQHSDSDGTFTLNWPGGESVYYLQQTAPSHQTYTTAGTSYSFSNLADGTYDFRLTGCHDEYDSGMCMNMQVCRSNTTIIRVIVQRPAPATPASLNVPGSDADGAYSVSWSSVSGATSYELQEQSNGGSFTTIQNNSATSRSISGKDNGSYGYRVRACNGAGCSGFTPVYTTHVALAPGIPSSLNLSLGTNGSSLSLNWSAASGAVTHYELQRSINGGGWSGVYSGTALSQSYSSLSAGNYQYQVRACRTTGSYTNCGGWRQSIMGYIAGGANDQGAYSFASWSGGGTIQYVDFDGSFTLSWPSANKEYYYLHQQGPVSQTYTVTGLSRSFTALPNGLYTFTVAGCHTEYNSSSCEYGEVCTTNSHVIQVLVHKPIPQVPGGLSAPSMSGTGAYTVSWNSVAAASSYELQEQVNGGGWSTVQNTSATNRNITDKGTGVYGYQVRACNDTGCSNYSSTVTTTVVTAPNIPASLNIAVGINGTSIAVNWTSGGGAVAYYEVQQRFNGGGWGTVYSGSALSQTFTGLSQGAYEYQIRAWNTLNSHGNHSGWRSSIAGYVPGLSNGVPNDQNGYAYSSWNGSNSTIQYVDYDGSFTLSWPSANKEYYYLHQQGPGGASQTHTVMGLSREFITLPNGLYTFTVTGCHTEYNSSSCEYGEVCTSNSRVIQVLVQKPIPQIPAPFNVPANDEDGAYTVSWGSVSGTMSYELQEQTNGGSFVTLQNTSATSRNITGKGTGVYGYQVRACNDTGCSDYSSVQTTTVTTPPGTPASLDLSVGADGHSIALNWSTASGAVNHYELEQRINGGNWSPVYGAGGTAGQSQTLSGLEEADYDYRVRACAVSNGFGSCSGWRHSIIGHVPGLAKITPSTDLDAYSFSTGWSTGTETIQYVDYDGTFTLSWQAAQGQQYYYFHRRDPNGQVHTSVPSTFSQSFTLLPNGLYTFWITGCHMAYQDAPICTDVEICDASNNRIIQVLVHKPIPSTPTPFDVPTMSDNGAYSVSWGAAEVTVHYEWQEQVNDGAWSAAQSILNTSISFSGKQNGVYGYRVRACNDVGCSEYTDVKTTRVAIPPNVPSLNVSVASTRGDMTLKWASTGGWVTHYELQQRLNGTWEPIYTGALLYKSFSSLAIGPHEFRLRACQTTADYTACSSWTNSVVGHIPGVDAYNQINDLDSYVFSWGTPASLYYVDFDGTFTLSWSAVASPYNSYYRLQQYTPDTHTYSQTDHMSGTHQYSRTFNDLPNGLYTFAVEGCYWQVNEYDEYGWDECTTSLGIQVHVQRQLPETPLNLTAPALTQSGAFTVSWLGVPAATRYVLQQQYNGNGGYVTIHDGVATSKAVTINLDGEYRYRVKACNSIGCSDYTEPKSVMVSRVPNLPPSLSASQTGPDSVTVTWPAVYNATYYILQERYNNGAWVDYPELTQTTLILPGKLAGQYMYRVQACNMNGCSMNSPYAMLTVDTTTLAQAADVYVLPWHQSGESPRYYDADGAFTLQWNHGNADYYELNWNKAGGDGSFAIVSGNANNGVVSHGLGPISAGIYTFTATACRSGGYDHQNCPLQDECDAVTAPIVIQVQTVLPPNSFTVPGTDDDGNYTIMWDPAPGADSYTLQESMNGGINWTTIQNDAAVGATLIGRLKGNYYSYRVNACNNQHGCSAFTSVRTTEVSSDPTDIEDAGSGSGSSSSGGASSSSSSGGGVFPAPNLGQSDPVGTIGGHFSVTPTGSASYSVSLQTPPGIGGMAPKLSLNYNSQGGNGHIGVGWSLGGLSAITRCPATLEQDNFNKGVTFTGNDRFCLDGQRLILVPNTGNYGSPGSQYRTELDGFSRITAVGSVVSGPASFIVETRTGEIMLYGATYDSSIEAPGRSNIMIWALSRITDSTGNRMEFVYDKSNSHMEFAPARIEYAFANGISGARVEFAYGSQVSPQFYFAGGVTRMTRLLETVTTYVFNLAVKEYRLDYETAPGSGRQRLTSLTECSRVSGTVCLEPTVFGWQGESSQPVEDYLGSGPNGHTASFESMHWPIDIDGDGEMELVYNRFGTNEYWYAGSSIKGGASGLWGVKGHTVGKGFRHWVMDINGDGLNDLVYLQENSRNYWVLVNKGDGSTELKHWATATYYPSFSGRAWPIDINGDGRMDLVYNRNGSDSFIPNPTQHYYVLIAQPNGLAVEQYLGQRGAHGVSLDGTHWVMDVNSDGLLDLVYNRAGTYEYYAMINNGNNTVSTQYWGSRANNAAYNYAHWQLDVNGDGLQDLVYTDGHVNYFALINNGNGGVIHKHIGTSAHWDIDYSGSHWITDTNADGVMDLVYKPKNDLWLWSIESRADGSRKAVPWGRTYLNKDDRYPMFIDASGDGQPDMVTVRTDGPWYSMLRNTSRPDLLESITDGLGNTTTVEYKPLTDASVYDRVENPYGQYSPSTMQLPMTVVAGVAQPDGLGGYSRNSYFYKQLKVNKTGRGILGFAEMIAQDHSNGFRLEIRYNQNFPLTGMVSSSAKCLDTGGPCHPSKTLETSEVSYVVHATVDQAKHVYPSVRIDTAYQLNTVTNTAVPVAMTTTTNANVDAYGNVGLITVDIRNMSGTEHYRVTTENTFENRTGSQWRLDLLRHARITKYLNGGVSTDANSVRETAFEYDPVTALLMKETVEPGRGEPFTTVTLYGRDGYGNITTSTVCAKNTGSCALGDLGAVALPNRTVTTVYDERGQFPKTITNALGETETRVYERKFGQMLSIIGPNQLTTRWEYDGFGRTLKEIRADGTVTVNTIRWCHYGCPTYGKYFTSTQSTGSAAVTEYFDALGRKLRTRSLGFNNSPIYSDAAYNVLGQVERISEPYFAGDPVYWTTSEYDLVGRPVRIIPPVGPVIETEHDGLTTTMKRTVNGQLRIETETRNTAGQTVSVTNVTGTTLVYDYDSQGNLITTETQGRPDTRITIHYDVLGRKTAMDDPDMGEWSYQYNAYGELISQTNALNQTVTMEYDRLGRLIRRTEPEGISTWAYGTAASYSAVNRNIGKLIEVTGPGNPGNPGAPFYRKTFGYDHRGRAVSSTTTLTVVPYDINQQSYTTSQTYDGAGRVSVISYPQVSGNVFQVKNNYTANGYLEAVVSPDGQKQYWTGIGANARGQFTSESLGDHVLKMQEYDEVLGWMTRTRAVSSAVGAGVLHDMEYDLDEVGNLNWRRDHRQSGITEHFQYDNLDQITDSWITGGNPQGNYVPKHYTYDALGNITSKTGIGNYSYGHCNAGPHAVCSTTGGQTGNASYTYNANGSMTEGNGRTVAYTSFNKPYQFSQGAASAVFHYDADRNRIFKTGGGKHTVYIGMTGTGNPLYEHEVQGDTHKHLHFIYAGGQALAVHTIENGSGGSSAKTGYFHRDHLGSVEAISNESGYAVTYLSYDPWGQPRNPDWSDAGGTLDTAPGNLGFTGHEMIPEIGLIHMNGRVYDPLLGKFLSADPNVQFEKDVRSYNRYAYVSNNPLKYTDPTGYFLKKLHKTFMKISDPSGSLWKLERSVMQNISPQAAQAIGMVLNFIPVWGPLISAAFTAIWSMHNGASNNQIFATALLSFISYAAGGMGNMGFASYVALNAFVGGISAMMSGGDRRDIRKAVLRNAAMAALRYKGDNPAEGVATTSNQDLELIYSDENISIFQGAELNQPLDGADLVISTPNLVDPGAWEEGVAALMKRPARILAENSFKVDVADNVYIVVVHHAAGAGFMLPGGANSGPLFVDSKFILSKMGRSGYEMGRPILLVSCNTAAVGGAISSAQQMSNLAGATVYAADSLVWLGSDGVMTLSNYKYNYNMNVPPKLGNIHVFNPK